MLTNEQRDYLADNLDRLASKVINYTKKRYNTKHIRYDDLVSYTYEGLVQAMLGYNGKHNLDMWLVNKSMYFIIDCIRRDGMSKNHVTWTNYKSTVNRCRLRLGREPTDEEVAKSTGFTVGQIKNLKQTRAFIIMECELPFDQKLDDVVTANPESILLSKQLIENFYEAIKTLKPLYQQSIKNICFGGYTHKEISEKEGITINSSQVRNVVAKKLLRKALNKKYPDGVT